MPAVSSLHVYPVKSLRGVAVDELRVERRGPRHDRRWMLVDEAGRFITQREHPRLALVDVAIDEGGRRLHVRAPAQGELEVPFEPAGQRREVEIWDDRVTASSVSEEARAYFSRYLEAEVDLVYMPDESERAVDPRYALAGDIVGFADGYAFLLANEASLDDLQGRMGSPIPMARFRPNVVVAGAPAFAEDTWTSLRIGALSFRVTKPCERCPIPTIDIETAERHKEPLATLATFRRSGKAVLFGQNLAHDGEGWLRVGDAVEVTAAREARI
jgi:uncharacterized protein YcbX